MNMPTLDVPKSISTADKFAKWVKDNQDTSQTFFAKFKIESVTSETDSDGRRYFAHDVVCTAPDEFTPPSRFTFRHSTKVGQKDDVMSCILRARFWFAKTVTSKIPDQNGEYGTWRPSKHAIDFVDYL